MVAHRLWPLVIALCWWSWSSLALVPSRRVLKAVRLRPARSATVDTDRALHSAGGDSGAPSDRLAKARSMLDEVVAAGESRPSLVAELPPPSASSDPVDVTGQSPAPKPGSYDEAYAQVAEPGTRRSA
jgi:hypothetical protein